MRARPTKRHFRIAFTLLPLFLLPLFPPRGDKDPGDLNHKLTIKNVQLTPRSIEDRWNRLDPAHHRWPSFYRNETRGGGGGRGRRTTRGGEKGETSREVGSNREGLIPLDCVPCPATPAHSLRLPFQPFRFASFATL